MIRLLRALVSVDLCAEPSPGMFTLTDAGALLRAGTPGSLRDYARFSTHPVMHDIWSRLEFSIRTGRAAFDEAFGMPAFEYLANEPELSAIFNATMSQGTQEDAGKLADYYDFGRFTTVTDVGGGNGTLLIAILARYPELKGVVFDTPQGAAQAADTVHAAGLSGRCAVETGDFFEAVPAGADLYLLKSVVHNWDDDRAVILLRRCREAMPSRGKLLIIDPIMPDTATPRHPATNPYLVDLDMLLAVGAQERTRAEFEKLCGQAGFTVTAVTNLPSHVDFGLIEAAPA